MLTIHDIPNLKVAKFMYKVSNHCETTNPSLFTLLTSIIITRKSTAKYFVNRTNTKSGCKSKLILKNQNLVWGS